MTISRPRLDVLLVLVSAGAPVPGSAQRAARDQGGERDVEADQRGSGQGPGAHQPGAGGGPTAAGPPAGAGLSSA